MAHFVKSFDKMPLSVMINDKAKMRRKTMRYGYLFEEYIKGGLMPFSLEEPDILPLLKDMLEKIINRDIAISAKITLNETDTMTKVVSFLGKSPVDGISFSSVAANLGITKYKMAGFLN
jgi:predicted AAA+ superfamily ATPase